MDITHEELDELYSRQRLGVPEIAARLNVSATTVYYWMDRFGLLRRSRSEARRLPLDDDVIERLYTVERLCIAEIAQKLDVCKETVSRRLEGRGVALRDHVEANRLQLDDNEIEQLYVVERLSAAKIARRLGVSESTVYRRLEERDARRRSPSEARIIYPRRDFSGDRLEKAYLLGFRPGDLYIKMSGSGPNSATIVGSCSTTRVEQVNLIYELFSLYGRVNVTPTTTGEHAVSFLLNMSFDFLLPKQDSIPAWVLRAAHKGDMQPFSAFLAGYTDAEGCFCVKTRGEAVFKLGSCDVTILRQIHIVINERLGIACPPVRLAGIYMIHKKTLCFHWHYDTTKPNKRGSNSPLFFCLPCLNG